MFRNFELRNIERWLCTKYETLKGGCVRSKNKFKTQKNNKLRWLATNINFNSYTLDVLTLYQALVPRVLTLMVQVQVFSF